MIYVFGCSMCNWHWPTWVDWLSAYGKKVKKLSYTGYGSQNLYWTLLEHIDDITEDDSVIMLWPSNHRIMQWYDQEWVSTRDVWGFFPNEQGDLWYTDKQPWIGLYRTHPDYQQSLTQGIIDNLNLPYQCQLLLEQRGIKYTMGYTQNVWLDVRPKYKPEFQVTYKDRNKISDQELELANNIISMSPINKLMNNINWDNFIDVGNPLNPKEYSGIWEYFISKKEYIIYKHETDQHPCPLAHHDYALEKILGIDPIENGTLRKLAEQISADCMEIEIPPMNFIGRPNDDLLLSKYKDQLI